MTDRLALQPFVLVGLICLAVFVLMRAERQKRERRERLHDAFAALADVLADAMERGQ